MDKLFSGLYKLAESLITDLAKDTRGTRGMLRGGPPNSPTFAYRTLYENEPSEFLSGRTSHPQRMWGDIPVDEQLKDEWLENLNALPNLEIRASCAGHGSNRPSYVVFRLLSRDTDESKKVVEELNKIEGVKADVDLGREGLPRICVTGPIWHDKEGWEEWWARLPERINQAVRSAQVKKTARCVSEYYLIKAALGDGIEYDLSDPHERYKQLLADLYYLSLGWSRLQEGKEWGDWSKEDIEKTYAKIIDTLRSKLYFPFIPPEEGTDKYKSSYWRLYRAAEPVMSTEPPSVDELKTWSDRRKKMLKGNPKLDTKWV